MPSVTPQTSLPPPAPLPPPVQQAALPAVEGLPALPLSGVSNDSADGSVGFYSDTLPRRDVERAGAVLTRARRCQRFNNALSRQSEAPPELRCARPDYIAKVYYGDKRDQWGRLFFARRDGKGPYCYYPHWTPGKDTPKGEAACVETLASGTSKKCTRYGGRNRFVALEPTSAGVTFSPSRLELASALFSGTSSLVFTTFINPALKIARDAGQDLNVLMNAGHVLPLDAFHSVVADVAQVHAMPVYGGAFFRDLKPENICARREAGGGPDDLLWRLSIVDVEDALVLGVELPDLRRWHVQGTKEYLTDALKYGIYTGRVEMRRHFAEAADLYALLRTLIAATAPADSALRHDACAHVPSHPGAMHAGNQTHFIAWIEAHVLPAFQYDIRLLLENPGRFAEERHRHPASLRDMLRFQRDLKRPPGAT